VRLCRIASRSDQRDTHSCLSRMVFRKNREIRAPYVTDCVLVNRAIAFSGPRERERERRRSLSSRRSPFVDNLERSSPRSMSRLSLTSMLALSRSRNVEGLACCGEKQEPLKRSVRAEFLRERDERNCFLFQQREREREKQSGRK